MEEQLWKACSEGKVEEVIKLLQNSQINTNWQKQSKYGSTPFSIACQKGYIEIVKILLNDQRVDITKATNSGWTPFHSVCNNGHIEIVKLLLNDKRIADINKATDDNGWTPFNCACCNGHIDIVKYLLESGREIDINKKDNKGKSGLDYAKEHRSTDIVQLIESFQRSPNETRANLRKELAIGKFF